MSIINRVYLTISLFLTTLWSRPLSLQLPPKNGKVEVEHMDISKLLREIEWAERLWDVCLVSICSMIGLLPIFLLLV